MVKPLNKWPRPAASAKPAELPSEIFYAVVVYDGSDNAPKKISSRRRNEFDHYVELTGKPGLSVTVEESWKLSDAPTLLTTIAEAQSLKSIVAIHYEDTESIQVFIQTFRLIESSWSAGENTWDIRRRDACDMAEGVISYDLTSEQIKKLAGKVLTILDASYVNENQNKAVKDLVKNVFRGQLSELWKMAYADINSGDCCEGKAEKDILD